MTLFERGYLRLFAIKNIPVRAHWSVPLVCLLFSGFRVEPGMWLGVLVVILIHELGHAFIVHRSGLTNLGIDLTGFGGLCRWTGQPTTIQRAAVAWGGVLAQFALLAIVLVVLFFTGAPENLYLRQLVEAFTRANLFIAVLNLIPIRPLDGAEAWPWFKHVYQRRKSQRKWKLKLVQRKTGKKDSPLSQTLREALDDADRRNLH